MHFFQCHSGLHRTVCLESVPWSGVLQIYLPWFLCHIWELTSQVFESTAGFIHTFHKVFHEAQLYVQRGQKNFLRKNKRRIDDIFLLWRQWCSLSNSLFTQWFFLSRLTHSHRKQQYFVYPSCIPSISATNLRSAHNFHLNSLKFVTLNLSQQ